MLPKVRVDICPISSPSLNVFITVFCRLIASSSRQRMYTSLQVGFCIFDNHYAEYSVTNRVD